MQIPINYPDANIQDIKAILVFENPEYADMTNAEILQAEITYWNLRARERIRAINVRKKQTESNNLAVAEADTLLT